jgi:hypothetical protein
MPGAGQGRPKGVKNPIGHKAGGKRINPVTGRGYNYRAPEGAGGRSADSAEAEAEGSVTDRRRGREEGEEGEYFLQDYGAGGVFSLAVVLASGSEALNSNLPPPKRRPTVEQLDDFSE